jgi:hypothetical protein
MKRIISGVFLLIATFATSWALLMPGFFRLHDFVHAARISELLRSAQDGHLPVQWTANFGYGYGMPLFEFYAPLPYYIGALFYGLGINVVVVIKLLYVICSVGTFMGMYFLGKRLFGRTGGILAATALTLAPYRAVNLYIRGSLSEAWGIMALPWILFGIVQVVRKEKSGWLTLLLGLSVLFLSHNITTLIFVPMSILFGLGFLFLDHHSFSLSLPNLRKFLPQTGVLTATYALAIGVCAFYLFPALVEKDFTKVSMIFDGYFHYSNHFLYIRQFIVPRWGYGGSEPGPNDGISFFFGWGHWLGIILSLLLAGWAVLRLTKVLPTKKNSHSFTFNAVLRYGMFWAFLLVSLFMTLERSKFIWDHFASVLRVVQFPWRWLSAGSVWLSLIIASGTYFISQKTWRYAYAVLIIGVMLVTTTMYFKPQTFEDVTDAFYYTDPQRIRSHMSSVLSDYIPIQMQLKEPSKQIDPIDVPYTVSQGDPSKVSLLVNHVQEKLLQTHFTDAGQVNFAVADFPGWNVYIDTHKTVKKVAPLGNIIVDVSKGEHTVGVRYEDTPIRSVSNILSLVSLGIFFFLVLPRPETISKKEKK